MRNKYVGKLTIALTMVLVSMFAVVTATFAWFNVVNTPEVGNIKFGADEGNEVLFSLDGTTWKNELTGDEIYSKLGIDLTKKFSNVTPVATANGFNAQFKQLKYTPNQLGTLGGTYSMVEATDKTHYLQIPIKVKSDVATELYLFDLFASVEGGANNEAAKNMVRVGFSDTETGVMKIFNPSSLSEADSYTKAGMGFGSFYDSTYLNNEFKRLVGSDLLSLFKNNESNLTLETSVFKHDGKRVTLNVTKENVASATKVSVAPSSTEPGDTLGKTVYVEGTGEVWYVNAEAQWTKADGIKYESSYSLTTASVYSSETEVNLESPLFAFDSSSKALKIRQVSYESGSAVYSYVDTSYEYFVLGTEHTYEAIEVSYNTQLATITSDQQVPTVANRDQHPTKICDVNKGGTTFYLTIWFEGWSGYSTSAAENGVFALNLRFIGDKTPVNS